MNEFWEARSKMDNQEIDDRLHKLEGQLALITYRLEQGAKQRRWLIIGLAVVAVALLTDVSPVDLIKLVI